MRKITLMVLAALLSTLTMIAQDFTTQGDGTTWTFSKLAEVVESGVTGNGKTFTMTKNVTVAAGDKFKIESGIKVLMGNSVKLTISGEADFAAGERVQFTSAGAEDKPYGIFVDSDISTVDFANIDFEYAGLRCFGSKGLNVDNCTFKRHNAVSNASALGLGTNGASFTVTNCTFEECERNAIGGAANYSNPIVIENCRFTGNGTRNLNAPQINLTVADNVTIRNNIVTGNPANNKVGGIVVSNMIGLKGTFETVIEGNEIRDNRFGIAAYNEQNALIKNNILVGNKYETNPDNGGSGINIYDPYKTQTTVVTGNYIEDNLWGITVIGGKDVNIGKTEDKNAADYNPGLNVFLNNGNRGKAYDLYNNSPNTVYAQGNYWKSVDIQDRESIETVVFHKNDDPSLGEVIFMPALTEEPAAIDNVQGEAAVRYIEVYTVNGVKVATMRGNELSGLKPGIYIVRAVTDKGCVIRRIAM